MSSLSLSLPPRRAARPPGRVRCRREARARLLASPSPRPLPVPLPVPRSSPTHPCPLSHLDELHVPLDVCGAVVKRELAFWRVDDRAIEPCCWISYTSFIDNEMTLAHYSAGVEREAGRLRAISSLVGWQRTRMQCWMVLDNPRYSRLAMVSAPCPAGERGRYSSRKNDGSRENSQTRAYENTARV